MVSTKSAKKHLIQRLLISIPSIMAIVVLCYLGGRWLSPPSIDQQSLYWIFTASAQSIAAFVAFLVAGYALFHSSMTDMLARDETLSDIIDEERQQMFSRLKMLLVLTGVSILMNLFMVFLNDRPAAGKKELIVLTFFLTVATIVLGMYIVIYMVDPRRNAKIATRMVKASSTYGQSGAVTTEQVFFEKFLQLERLIREYIQTKDVRTKTTTSLPDAFRALYYRGVYDKDFLNRLSDVNRYRNLLFHGQITQSSKKMVDELDYLLLQLKIKLAPE